MRVARWTHQQFSLASLMRLFLGIALLMGLLSASDWNQAEIATLAGVGAGIICILLTWSSHWGDGTGRIGNARELQNR